MRQSDQPVNGTRKMWAIAIPALLVAALVALGVAFLAGAVRFGTVKITRVTTASKVDENTGKPVKKTSSFSDRQDRVYCCAYARAFEDTVLESRWYHGGKLVGRSGGKFKELIGASTGKFITAGGNVVFYRDRPAGGWAPGTYKVELLMSGKQAPGATFTIAKQGSEESGGMQEYADPAGRFSVSYPDGWEQADSKTLDGALAGFIAPGGGDYPPRFAIVMTDFESAGIDALNAVLKAEGRPDSENFSSYSFGDKQGARRMYTWESGSGGKTVQLKSIQAVVQGSKHVYGLNCHCQASQFDANLPLFDSIISSFRVNE
jgi:hypothetical protein